MSNENTEATNNDSRSSQANNSNVAPDQSTNTELSTITEKTCSTCGSIYELNNATDRCPNSTCLNNDGEALVLVHQDEPTQQVVSKSQGYHRRRKHRSYSRSESSRSRSRSHSKEHCQRKKSHSRSGSKSSRSRSRSHSKEHY